MGAAASVAAGRPPVEIRPVPVLRPPVLGVVFLVVETNEAPLENESENPQADPGRVVAPWRFCHRASAVLRNEPRSQ